MFSLVQLLLQCVPYLWAAACYGMELRSGIELPTKMTAHTSPTSVDEENKAKGVGYNVQVNSATVVMRAIYLGLLLSGIQH